MSTPHQGPDQNQGLRWTPGDVQGAATALAGLDERQQAALRGVLSVSTRVAAMVDAASRAIQSLRRTVGRLSDLARRLVSTDRQVNPALPSRSNDELRQAAGERINRGTERAAALGSQLSERAGRAVAGARDGLVQGAQAIGRVGAAAVRQGVEKGKQGAQWVNENAVKPTTRWFNAQIGRGAAKAAASLEALAQRRLDPNVAATQQNSPDLALQKRDALLVQHAADLATASPDQRAAKAAALAAFIQNEYGNQNTGPQVQSTEQTGQDPARDAKAAENMAWVLGPNAPASSIRKPGGQESQQGGQSQEGTGQHRKPENTKNQRDDR